jgi:hypothetical protein
VDYKTIILTAEIISKSHAYSLFSMLLSLYVERQHSHTLASEMLVRGLKLDSEYRHWFAVLGNKSRAAPPDVIRHQH